MTMNNQELSAKPNNQPDAQSAESLLPTAEERYLTTSRPVLIRLAGVINQSVVDGPGIRHVLFLQGCEHHCPGCHNPQTHDRNGGQLRSIQDTVAAITQHPWLAGITFSGGEPFLQPRACIEVIDQLRAQPALAHFNYLAYTGFTYERLLELAQQNPAIALFLSRLDILIDGPFILAQRDLNLAFRGSRNQRILNLHELRGEQR